MNSGRLAQVINAASRHSTTWPRTNTFPLAVPVPPLAVPVPPHPPPATTHAPPSTLARTFLPRIPINIGEPESGPEIEPEPELEIEPEPEPGSQMVLFPVQTYPSPFLSDLLKINVSDGDDSDDDYDPPDLPDLPDPVPDPHTRIPVTETKADLIKLIMGSLADTRKFRDSRMNCIDVIFDVDLDSDDTEFLTLIFFILECIKRFLITHINGKKQPDPKSKCYIATEIPEGFSVKIELKGEELIVKLNENTESRLGRFRRGKNGANWVGGSISVSKEDKQKYIMFLRGFKSMLKLGTGTSSVARLKHTKNKKKHTKKKKKHTKKRKKKNTKQKKKKNTKRRR